jgi:hypothetical protein
MRNMSNYSMLFLNTKDLRKTTKIYLKHLKKMNFATNRLLKNMKTITKKFMKNFMMKFLVTTAITPTMKLM